MKKLFLFFTFITLSFFAANSQLINDLNVPQMQASMPAWAKLMYQYPINLLKIDSAYKEYYSTHEFVKSEYTRYYKRLIMQNRMFMTSEGIVNKPSADVIEKMFGGGTARFLQRNKRDEKATNAQTQQANNEWKPINMETFFLERNRQACPWQVNVYGFDISKSNPNILVAGAETGSIYRTADKGKTWEMIGREYSLGTEAICIHPTNPDIIYIGTGGALRKSSDAGKTWATIHAVSGIDFYDVDVNYANTNIILTASNKGLYRSTDAGETWNLILNTSVSDIEINPTKPAVVYVARYDAANNRYEPYKSTNYGESFVLKNSGWHKQTSSGIRMCVTPADPKRIYAIALTNLGPHLLRSDDEGETWTITAKGSYKIRDYQDKVDSITFNSKEFPMDNWQGYYDLSIAASHTNADQVVTGTGSTYKSTDGGKTFVVIGGYGGSFPLHPDLQEAKCNGGDSWIATDGGLTYSTDFFADTKNAEARNYGINGSDFWGFDAGWNEDIFVGGRYHNGNTVWHENYNNKYVRMGGAESPTGYVNPIKNRDVYHSDIGAYTMPAVYDTAWKWFRIPCGRWPNESYYAMEHSDMVWSPVCYSTVFLGQGNVLYKSTNNAVGFDSIFATPRAKGVVESIEISRSNPNVIYFKERNNSPAIGYLWKSTNGGKTFDTLTKPTNTSNGELRVSTIALSGTNENVLWYGLRTGGAKNKVFKTTDGGKSWQNLTTPTIGGFNISDIAHQLGTDDGVYIACDGGKIFYRNKRMADWEDFSNGLGVQHFTRNLRIFYRDNKIRSGSNTGVWESPLYEKSTPLAQPTVDKQVTECPKDTFYFDDYSALEKDLKTAWNWEFQGAEYVSDKNVRNPKVVFGKVGKYPVTLTVSNSLGSNTKVVEDIVEIKPSLCEIDTVAGLALNLNKRGDYATLDPIHALKNASGFSCSAWIKLDSMQDCFTQIISNWGSNVGMGFGFAFQGYRKTTNLTFSWKGVAYQLTSAFNLDTTKWIHVAMVVYPDSVRLYRNGESWTYKGNFKDFDLGSTPWEIGQGVPGQCGDFEGQIDELKIYNRIISQDEVRANMHLIFPKQEQGLVAYYQFNEPNNKNVFYDKSNIAHGAYSGALRVASTAPVALGKSFSIKNVLQGKNKFDSTGLSANLKAEPSTEIMAYRLFAAPDSLPKNAKNLSNTYWIVRSWGNKKAIPYEGLEFKDLGKITKEDMANSNLFKLYKRAATNEHLSVWQEVSSAFIADSVTRSATFPADTNLVGQYIIEALGNSVLDVKDYLTNANSRNGNSLKRLVVSPNPAISNKLVVKYLFDKNINSLKEIPITVYNSIGQKVLTTSIYAANPQTVIETSDWANGAYYVAGSGEKVLVIVKR